MVRISDVIVSEEKIIETPQPVVDSTKNESKEKSVTKKKSKSGKQSRGMKLAQSPNLSKEKHDYFKNNIYIVFVECETPGNIGFLARTMANFGLKNLVLINPPELTEEAFYQATHGKYIVENAKIYKTLDEFFENQIINFKVASTGVAGGSYNLSRIAIKPEELGKTINTASKTAILFGREGNGLTNEEINKCDITITIPTDPTYPIMNVSHAAAIIFYELFKNRHEFPAIGLDESTTIEKEYVLKDMEDIINILTIPEHKKKNGLKSFKNIINRAFITGREAHTLKGILRRIKNKLNDE